MAVSQHWAAQQARIQRLLEEDLVPHFGLERGSSNYKRAVKFALANLGDSQYPYPAPTQVKARLQGVLEKLELHSQLSKRSALADTVERLQARHAAVDNWDVQEKLFGTLALLLNLSEGVVARTEASNRQVAMWRERAELAAQHDDSVPALAAQLRAVADDWAAADSMPAPGRKKGADDSLSDWSSGSETDDRAGESPVDDVGQRCEAGAEHAAGARGLSPGKNFGSEHEQARTLLGGEEQEERAEDEGTLRLWRMQHLVMHEKVVVAEILAMLHGSPGPLFGIRPTGEQSGGVAGKGIKSVQTESIEFFVKKRIALLHVSPQALARVLEWFVRRASALARVRSVTERMLHAGSAVACTIQALFSCVHDHLAVIDVYVHEVASLAKNDGGVCLATGTVLGGDRARRASLTLLVLAQVLKKQLDMVRVLEEVVRGALHRDAEAATEAQQAHHALAYLYTTTVRARMLPDRMRYRVLHRIFAATMEPYLRILETWLYEGSLAADKRSEFFIYARPLEELSQDGGEEEDLGREVEVAASLYWQRFAIRLGGDVVYSGHVVACSAKGGEGGGGAGGRITYVQLDPNANSRNDFYCGMTLSVRSPDGAWDSGIVTAYHGGKRRAYVALNTAPSENTEAVVTTVVPPFLRYLATRVLAAGKSVNVLLLEQLTSLGTVALLAERGNILRPFVEAMNRSSIAGEAWGVHALEVDPQLQVAMLMDRDRDRFWLGPDADERDAWQEEDSMASAATTICGEESPSPPRPPSLAQMATASLAATETSPASKTSLQPSVLPTSSRHSDLDTTEEGLRTVEAGHDSTDERGCEHLIDAEEVGAGWARRQGTSGGVDLSTFFHASLGRDGSSAGCARSEESSRGDRTWGGKEEETDWAGFGAAVWMPSSSLHTYLEQPVTPDAPSGSHTSEHAEEGDAVNADEANTEGQRLASELVPLETVLDVLVMKTLENRVAALNRSFVSHLNNSFHLPVHMAALRRVFFMAAGDVLHEFAMYLFDKLDVGEPWSDVHALNTMLQASLPPIAGVEYGMVTAYTAAVHQEQRVRLRASTAADDKQDVSITALDSLRLDYAVAWPLNLIINPPSLQIYNQILVFLLQIKRAKCALASLACTHKHPDEGPSIAERQRAARRQRDRDKERDRVAGELEAAAAHGRASEEYIETERGESAIRARALRLGGGAMEDDVGRCSQQRFGAHDREYLGLRAELSHIINNLENYIMHQVHSGAAAELEAGLLEADNLDDITARHTKFLHRMRDRCLLHSKAVVVADTVRKILNLALDFRRWYPQYESAQDALGKGEEDFATHDKMQQATANLQRVATELRQCVRFVVVVLEKIVAKGFHPHLEDLLTRLNFNHFYDRIKGRGRAAISQPL